MFPWKICSQLQRAFFYGVSKQPGQEFAVSTTLWCICFAQKFCFTPLLEWISRAWKMTSNNTWTPKTDKKLSFESSWEVENINMYHSFGNILSVLLKGILYFQKERTRMMWITLSEALNKELYLMGQKLGSYRTCFNDNKMCGNDSTYCHKCWTLKEKLWTLKPLLRWGTMLCGHFKQIHKTSPEFYGVKEPH